MNIENLSDEEKRVKIAEACGWTPAKPWEVSDDLRLYAHPNRLPDYLNDLNAMAEVEASHPATKTGRWVKAMHRATGARASIDYVTGSFHVLLNATARQRADAFLLCL